VLNVVCWGVWMAEARHHARFCQNSSIHCGDIVIFRFFKTVATGILGCQNRKILLADSSRSISVCLSVCLSTRITRKPHGRNSPNFCPCCLCPCRPLKALRYVKCFRFYGWRQAYHVDGPRLEAAFRRYFYRPDVTFTRPTHQILVAHGNIFRFFVLRYRHHII